MDTTDNKKITDWEYSYNKSQSKCKKLKKKYKKNKDKIKKLKAERKNSYGVEEKRISKKIDKHKRKCKKWKQKRKDLEKKLHEMEMLLQKQKWENEYLKKQVNTERRLAYLESQGKFLSILLEETAPGLVRKYGRGKKPTVIDVQDYEITKIDD